MSRTRVAAWLREMVAEEALYRCGYCLMAEHIVGMPMELDHLIPDHWVALRKLRICGSLAQAVMLARPIGCLESTRKQGSRSDCSTRVGNLGRNTFVGLRARR
jgi:hypothetical protein